MATSCKIVADPNRKPSGERAGRPLHEPGNVRCTRHKMPYILEGGATDGVTLLLRYTTAYVTNRDALLAEEDAEPGLHRSLK